MFGLRSVPAAYVSSSEVTCVSPPNAVGPVQVAVSVNGVLSSQFSYNFEVLNSSEMPTISAPSSSNTLQVLSVSKFVSSLAGGSVVRIFTSSFDYVPVSETYFCYFGDHASVSGMRINFNDRVSDEFVASSSGIECRIPSAPTAATVPFSVKNTDGTVLLPDTDFSFLLQPSALDPIRYLSSMHPLMLFIHTNIVGKYLSIQWDCVVDDIRRAPAYVLDDGGWVTCDISGVLHRANSTVRITDINNDLRTNTLALDNAMELEKGGEIWTKYHLTDVSATDAIVNARSVSPISDADTLPSTCDYQLNPNYSDSVAVSPQCLPISNYTATVIAANRATPRGAMQNLFFKKSSSPPRNLAAALGNKAEEFSAKGQRESSQQQLFGFNSGSSINIPESSLGVMGSSDCFIGSGLNRAACLTLAADAGAFVSEDAAVRIARAPVAAVTTGMLIDSVVPYKDLDPSNGTWVHVTGRNFLYNVTECLLNGDSDVMASSVVLSSTFMYCYIPSRASMRAASVILSLRDTSSMNATHSINSVELFYVTREAQFFPPVATTAFYDENADLDKISRLGALDAAISGQPRTLRNMNSTKVCLSESGCYYNPISDPISVACDSVISSVWASYLVLNDDLLRGNSTSWLTSPIDFTACRDKNVTFQDLLAYQYSSGYLASSISDNSASYDVSTIQMPTTLSTLNISGSGLGASLGKGSREVLFTVVTSKVINESSAGVFFYSAGFNVKNRWCHRMAGEYTRECIIVENTKAVSHTSLHCPLYNNLPPGVYSSELLIDCKASVANRTIELVPFMHHAAVGVELFNSKTNSDNVLAQQLPRVTDLKPAQGPTVGGTKLYISGRNVESIGACRFTTLFYDGESTSKSEIISVPTTKDEQGHIWCSAPRVTYAGRASIDFSVNGKVWLIGGMTYDYYITPMVSAALNIDESGTVNVLGYMLPISFESFCRLTFSNDLVMTLAAEMLSTTNLRCGSVPYHVFSVVMLNKVEVSFNGQDYLEAPMSPRARLMTNATASISLMDIKVVSISQSVEQLTPKEKNPVMYLRASQLRAITQIPQMQSMFCNGNDTLIVPFDTFAARQAVPYSCLLDGKKAGRAIFVSGNSLVCPIPSKRPGTYELLIVADSTYDESDPDPITEMPRIVEVRCLNNPIIRSGAVSMDNHGSQVLTFLGMNLMPATEFWCNIGDFAAQASIISQNKLSCVLPAILPAIHNVTVTVSQTHELFHLMVCFTDDLLVIGGNLTSDLSGCITENSGKMNTALFASKKEPVRFISNSTQSITMISPRIGLTDRPTVLDVFAPNIYPGQYYECLFGENSESLQSDDVTSTPALVVANGRLICNTPSNGAGQVKGTTFERVRPGNMTVGLRSYHGERWCCSWFAFSAALKIVAIAPNVIQRAGGNIVIFTVSGLQTYDIYLHADLMCNFGTIKVPAFRNGNSTVSCVTPAIADTAISVSLGSQQLVMSNTLTIDVAPSTYNAQLVPSHGSYRGGTKVVLTLPDALIAKFVKPTLAFSGVDAADSHYSTEPSVASKSVITAVVPSAVHEGPVQVTIYDRAFVSSRESQVPIFTLATYMYEKTATVGQITPNSVTHNKSVDLIVQGSFFRDSPQLACVLNQGNFAANENRGFVVRARWLTDTMIMCRVSAEATATLSSPINVRACNNCYRDQVNSEYPTVPNIHGISGDVSESSAMLDVRSVFHLVSVTPMRGFTRGRTPVTLVFQNNVAGPLKCRFGNAPLQVAVRIEKVMSSASSVDASGNAAARPQSRESHTYMCTAPDYAAGAVSLQIVDEGLTVLATVEYEYVDMPVVDASLGPAIILASSDSSLFDIKLIGLTQSTSQYLTANVRQMQGAGAIVGNCVATLQGLQCSATSTKSDSSLFVDISVNHGVDYVLRFTTVQIVPRMEVLALRPFYLFSNGGSFIEFQVLSTRSPFGLVCEFKTVYGSDPERLLSSTARFPLDRNNQKIITVAASTVNNNTMSCISPILPSGKDNTELRIIQNGYLTVFGPMSLVVHPEPMVVKVSPLVIVTGVPTALFVTFRMPIIPSIFECVLVGGISNTTVAKAPLKFVNSTTASCNIHPLQSMDEMSLKIVQLRNAIDAREKISSIEGSKMQVINAPVDLKVNVTAILSSAYTYVSVRSNACQLPPYAYCQSVKLTEGTQRLSTVSQSSCELICIVTPSFNMQSMARQIRFSVCPSWETSCQHPLLDTVFSIVTGVTIVALSPARGSVLGGNMVTLHGSGFTNEGLSSLECVFGRAAEQYFAAKVVVESPTKLHCQGIPAGKPGMSAVHLRAHNSIVLGTSYVEYEYLPYLSTVNVSSTSISAAGGTGITITTRTLTGNGPFECRFKDLFVPAVMMNDTALFCRSPILSREYLSESVDFSVSVNKVDISIPIDFQALSAPVVLFADPLVFQAFQDVSFTFIFDYIVDNSMDLHCAITNIDRSTNVKRVFMGRMSYDGTVVAMCTVRNEQGSTLVSKGSLQAGNYNLTLSQLGTEFFHMLVAANMRTYVNRVYPLSGFSSMSTAITITTSATIETSAVTRCCFGTNGINEDGSKKYVYAAATVVSSNEWRCYTPILKSMIDSPARLAVGLSVGATNKEGACEEAGFSFDAYALPSVLSVSPTSGLNTGGTAVEITFSAGIGSTHAAGLSSMLIYCRLGSEGYAGQMLNEHTLLCFTRDSKTGFVDIEVSVNGIDFISIGHEFEFQPLGTLDKPIPFPVIEPVVYYVMPKYTPAGLSQTVKVYGEKFMAGATCYIGSSIALLSTVQSQSEIECVMPVHIPGKEFLTVRNPGSEPSVILEITFINPASVQTEAGAGVVPAFGPREGYTVIQVFGTNFDLAAETSNGLLCLIGDDWAFATEVTQTSLKCTAPPSAFTGKVNVKVANSEKEFLPGTALFEYIEDPIIFDAQPSRGTMNTEVVIYGRGFLRTPSLTCMFGPHAAVTTVVDDRQVLCSVGAMDAGVYSLTLLTNGQHYIRSGVEFENIQRMALTSLFPLNGPALKGSTILTVYGHGFTNIVDIKCNLGSASSDAVVYADDMLKCRLPPQRPGRVSVTLTADGALLHNPEDALEFLYTPDVSVDKVTPPSGYTAGGYAVFVFGSNFLNTTSLGCAFADMKSRGIYLSNTSLICLAPSPIGRSQFATNQVSVEITVNGYDYSESRVQFTYSEPCDSGFFCPGLGRSLCPNGTFCPQNSRNFTLCPPGFFQPREGQPDCAICPIGYICPDLGMSRPIVCPAGAICDVMGLRVASKSCPQGQYCLNATKASSADNFASDRSGRNGLSAWFQDYVSGVWSFNATVMDYSYKVWTEPFAVGSSRPLHPPALQCDGLDCEPGSLSVIAEAPWPCPIGSYCRTGVTSQTGIPKNFSTPQRCFDGFFCPRGSISPEGTGPCPNGYFCPTQLDAIICPRGHYCPGVGNRSPVECYPGTYNPFEGRANCTVCPTGHVCPGWGTLLPELCPAGYVCMSLGLSFPVAMCPQGYYCSEGTLTLDPSDPTPNRPIPCQAGVFCLGGVSKKSTIDWVPSQPYGKTHSQPCSQGTYCKQGAFLSSGSGLCFPGHYCPPNLDFPLQTPIGNFAKAKGSVAPTLCFPGTYAPLNAQVDCLLCPSGHTCQSYGTYKPEICPKGTFRSQVDSVTCRSCATGTYSVEVGSTDMSMCYPCPQGRVCGLVQMISLADSEPCPAGYICGYGTDRTRQFGHKAPGGFHTDLETQPKDQYSSLCLPGYYCPRGTSTAVSLRAKCTVGFYCPSSTSSGSDITIRCPKGTTSLSGAPTVDSCLVREINVCDKIRIDPIDPYDDVHYLPKYSYQTLDGTNLIQSFDSSSNAAIQTGEIRVVKRIQITNESASVPYWQNDTIDVFRACPQYGSGSPKDQFDADAIGGVKITIIGKNFRDTGLNYCKFRSCISANQGRHPRRCKNQVVNQFGNDLPVAGEMSTHSYVVQANYVSPTRVECYVPEYIFEDDFAETLNTDLTQYSCEQIHWTGFRISPTIVNRFPNDIDTGNFSYVRQCYDPLICMDRPDPGFEYFVSLVIPCHVGEIFEGICGNNPETGYFFNPCFSGEVAVEVTNDGEHYSGGLDASSTEFMSGQFIRATVQSEDQTNVLYRFYKDFTRPSTFATYTYVRPEFWYTNNDILTMEKGYCRLPRYSEEGYRPREAGWFMVPAHSAAHVHLDWEHLPDDLIYNQHFTLHLSILPSRCKVELCSSSAVRLSPEEYTPCRKSKELPDWWEYTKVPKNVKNNLTVYALDDLIFKVEVEILHGLFRPWTPLFTNSSIVRIISPQRSRNYHGQLNTTTRRLSNYVSFEERQVSMLYIFCMVYHKTDTEGITQAWNMPPMYQDYEKGRALIMYNASARDDIPLYIPPPARLDAGTAFWDQPASTLGESKEMLDAYYETFHGTTYTEAGYQFQFEHMLMPYLPYFSSCNTFDSYIPFWMLVEDELECALPAENPKNWFRYKFDPLPDQDNTKVVSPFNILMEPVADWCERSLKCNYEEDLAAQTNAPRWFEVQSGSLFQILRYPVDYYEYTGRTGTRATTDDAGGQQVILAYQAISEDNFIPVNVDGSAAATFSPLCQAQCFARSWALTVNYMQLKDPLGFYDKRIILASLVGDLYDFDQETTAYDFSVSYYALGWFDLILNFAFSLPIFMALFAAMGMITCCLCYAIWLMTRITTILKNPPSLRLTGVLSLTVPPSIAGTFIALIPIFFMTSLGNMVLNGHFFTDPNAPTIDPWGSPTTNLFDFYNLAYATMQEDGVPTDITLANILPEEQLLARSGRIGSVFVIVGICCLNTGNKMFFPKGETKRARDLARRRIALAEKEELWTPILWLKANFMFSAIAVGLLSVQVVELSFWGSFGDYIFTLIVMMELFGDVVKAMLIRQLQDNILVAPISGGYAFVTQLVTFGSPDFVQFLLSFFVGFAMQVAWRIFYDQYMDMLFGTIKGVFNGIVKLILWSIPKYLHNNQYVRWFTDEFEEKEFKKREIEGIVDSGDPSESVEPILELYNDFCVDAALLWYMPYFVYLFMQYRVQIGIPGIYGIRQSDMLIYLVFQVAILFFQPICDAFNLLSIELYHGMKIFDYLVYSRYRFLQRETRWKGMEDSLDECIEESLRKLDQMCFSSQYYLMIVMEMNGVIYMVFAMEIWLRTWYSPFTDAAFPVLCGFLVGVYVVLEWVVLYLAVHLKVWKIKHENTSWHILQKEEDELDIPGWEDLKGASHEAYLMNQRITSETFRYKFLNYNRTWLINQLPQLLTPRTLRRSRPYLINQFARIINARREDISDDSEGDHRGANFGAVALTAPSRNIIRWWLGKAKRRLRLKNIVEPLIRRARGAECEQCLSRKKLQIEYEVEVDKMSDMYDAAYPGDEEVDQVQWKTFWMNNQRYHTICLSCLTKRKEIATRAALAGVMDLSMYDDKQEDYPDWGPVYLTAASKAILLNWYRKAQRVRQGKKGAKVRKPQYNRDVSDDEGDEKEATWTKNFVPPTAATVAIAIKWVRTARARIQKKKGKGAGLKESDLEESYNENAESFKSGQKSKNNRK